MTPAEETRDRIATMAVTLRAFARAAGADSAILLLDRGDSGQPFVVDCPQEGLVTLAEGETSVELDPERLAAEPLPLPDVRPLGPVAVDALRAEITAPLGAVESLARAVRELAGRFPGRSVLSATFATSDPDTPLQLAARPGDPLVVVLGEEQFEMPAGWAA
jgi:hypothetical protein